MGTTDRPLVEEFFDVENVLVWKEGSMGIGDLPPNGGYARKFLILATNADRAKPLTDPTRNVLEYGRLPWTDYVYRTQKPEPLLVVLV